MSTGTLPGRAVFAGLVGAIAVCMWTAGGASVLSDQQVAQIVAYLKSIK
jgi:hypothetical protein